jgi:hypothetical protein
MSFFEDLTKKATGLLADIKGTTDGGTSSANLQSMFQNADTSRATGQMNTGMNIPSARGAGNYFQDPNLISSDPLKRVTRADGVQIPVKTIDRNARANIPTQFPPKSTVPKTKDDVKKNALGITNEQSKKFFGMDLNQIKASWKDKGGFEGLMANPGFTLGLAIMSSSAQGRPISESLLQNVLASGEISSAYADRISARAEVLAPVTQEQRDEVESVLAEDNYYGPDIIDKAKKGNQAAKFREATDLVYDRADSLAKKDASKSGKKVRLDRNYFRKALDQLISEGKLKKRDPSFFGLRAGTIEATGGIDGARAEGGPVEANKNYLVGEKGPEVFVPQVDGNIINNDDAKVVNMLLEHNPQLKNISRARAVKILKNRFPDYF